MGDFAVVASYSGLAFVVVALWWAWRRGYYRDIEILLVGGIVVCALALGIAIVGGLAA